MEVSSINCLFIFGFFNLSIVCVDFLIYQFIQEKIHLRCFDPMSFLQLLVCGQSGANGPSATHLGSMARSSDSVTALLQLMPAMAIQLKRLLAQVVQLFRAG